MYKKLRIQSMKNTKRDKQTNSRLLTSAPNQNVNMWLSQYRVQERMTPRPMFNNPTIICRAWKRRKYEQQTYV